MNFFNLFLQSFICNCMSCYLTTCTIYFLVYKSFTIFHSVLYRRVKYIWNSLNVYYLGFFLTYLYYTRTRNTHYIEKKKKKKLTPNKLLWNDSINLFLFISWKHQQKIILLSFQYLFYICDALRLAFQCTDVQLLM
jgi:hypothetical protein